jgi:hypothetical protein
VIPLKAFLWNWGLLFLCLSFLSGCTLLWPRRVPREILSPTDLFQCIGARNQQIQSIRARARVSINIGENRFTLEELIIAEKPTSLRVEVLSLIGQPLLYLTTDGKVFEALVPAENRLYRGEAATEYLSTFFSFHGGTREIIPLMLGDLGWTVDQRLAATFSEKDNVYIVTEDSAIGSRRIFWIDPFHFAPVRATELDERGNPRWEILSGNFKKREEIPFPTSIEFRSFSSDSRIRMRLLEWKINPSVEEGTFRLNVPKGVEIIEVK